MSIRLDLTTIAPELMDAVIYMDNSPAYAAFKEEIEAILADFNATGHLSSSWTVDPGELTAKSEDTLKNMHRAYLIWSYSEEKATGADPDCSCHTMCKLFFKAQAEVIKAVNGGEETIAPQNAANVIESFKAQINSDAAVFDSVKDFFKKYVYGYFFNFLSEAKIMKKYAEMLAYLGVMSNKIPTSVSEQQKVLPKMALLLSNDRFKYLNGFVPKSLMLDIVFDRIEFATLSEVETKLVKERIVTFITNKYKTDKEDDVELLSDDVTASFASDYFGKYINVPEFCEGLYRKCASGIRTFLDCDRDDTGDYSAAKLTELTGAKCLIDYNSFYTTEKEPCNDTSLGGTDLCWKYPIIFRDASDYFFAPVYEELVYPVLDRDIYTIVPEGEIPYGIFPFADEAFKTNTIRTAAGISDNSISFRKDRAAVLEQLKRLSTDNSTSPRDRKMLMLEQTLCLVSGNCSEAKYKALITENVFGTDLYEEYIRYRMDLLVGSSLTSLEAKKVLLDEVNKIG